MEKEKGIWLPGERRDKMEDYRQKMQKYLKKAQENQVDPHRKSIPKVSYGEVTVRREKNLHVRAYFNQYLGFIRQWENSFAHAYMLLDPDGCVIKLSGEEGFVSLLRSRGIDLGSIWKVRTIGPNAVTVGVRMDCEMESSGTDNYLDILKDYTIYFAPISVHRGTVEQCYGGIAMLTSKEERSVGYMTTITAIASGIAVRMEMAYRQCASFGADSRGVMMIDINIRTGAMTATHHNENFWKILGLPVRPYADVYFHPISEFIDPYPMNKMFWDIIENLRQVTDQEVPLTVQGKKLHVIMSTSPTVQPNMNSKGVLIYLTTRQQVSRQISEKTNNGAVLSFRDIVGECREIRFAISKAEKLAGTDNNVMLLGESGVGKDVFAQAIHNASSRKDKPFIAVNCGAIPRELIASELFGYEGGAFTGAKKQGNIGKFELADGGTLFLDEIGELPMDLQASLLRAVEQKQFMRVGSSKVVSVDVKIISATNVDMDTMIEEKRFRPDLYYRLGTMQLFIPPLRERGNDIVLLSEFFINRIALRTYRAEIPVLTEEAKQFLLHFEWEGNVRELQNLIECVVQLYPDRQITLEHIMENINPRYLKQRKTAWKEPETISVPVKQKRAQLTSEDILKALEHCSGNRSEAARYLGIARKTLYRNMERLGLSGEE